MLKTIERTAIFQKTEYQFNFVYLKVIPKNHIGTLRIERPKNQAISIINEYYDDFISFKHLRFYHYIGLLMIFLLSAYTLKIIFLNTASENFVIFSVMMCGVLFICIREDFMNNVLKNYNKKYQANFDYLWQAQDDWLKRKFGENCNPNELFKQFDEWKTKRDKYPTHKSFPIRKYTYHSDAKPRINALIIAFLSLNAVIFINISRPIDFDDFLINIAQNFFYFLFLFPFIAILFYFALFLRGIITDMIFYFYDIQKSKNILSEEKYKKFMGLLAQKLDIDN